MLDENLIEQLRAVFQNLEKPVELVLFKSSHDKQDEMQTMLNQVVALNPKLKVTISNEEKSIPTVALKDSGGRTCITFSGVPGGHEFSSFILAILNSGGYGKMPDAALSERIQAIRGPVKLRTYVSLSCENCPEVVQALNQIALLHTSLSHEIIDGDLKVDEVTALHIQGVPAVFIDDQLVASGKNHLGTLVQKLEEQLGKSEVHREPKSLGEFDITIIGAGPAGATAAIYAKRKGLKVAVIADKLGGQLRETKGIENFISVPYTEGPELAANLYKHMKAYEIPIYEHRRVSQIKTEGAFTLELDSKEYVSTRAAIVATGAKWRELNVPGEKEYLGRGVAFCPHCDGPFYKGLDIAVVGGGNSGVEAAIDLAGIVNHVTLIEFADELRADAVLVQKLKGLPNTSILTGAQTTEVVGNGQHVTSLRYKMRKTNEMKEIVLRGVFVQIGLVPNSEFLGNLVEKTKFGEIIVDEKCRTNTKGIYAAGDVTTVPYKQIVISMGEGSKAALSAFEDLMLR